VGEPEEVAKQQIASGEPSHSLDKSVSQDPTNYLWERLRRHKVVEWVIAYIAFAYAVLHGSQMLRETLEWPAMVPRFTLFALLLGFPVAVTLAWYHGHRAQHRVSRIEISILAALLVIGGSMLWWLSRSTHEGGAAPVIPSANTTTSVSQPVFSPPAHSVAVLPFVNISADKDQEYFSDGLTDEVLNSLARMDELQVTGRTSSFSFKGKDVDIATVAHKLNVAAVLEGSVRRSGNRLRITTQLINPITGYHLWTQTYDENLGDVLRIQTEIADAVAKALKATLVGDTAARVELGGTRNAEALDVYLRASATFARANGLKDFETVIAGYTEAIRLDPSYALAFADRATARVFLSGMSAPSIERELLSESRADAERAVALAPGLGRAHLALANAYDNDVQLIAADREYARARALAPGDSLVLALSGQYAVHMGRIDVGLADIQRATVLDPLDRGARTLLADALFRARRHMESIAAVQAALAIDPNEFDAYGIIAANYYLLGDFGSALAWCEMRPGEQESQAVLALTYDKLGRHADAQAMLAKLQAAHGENRSFIYAVIYTQWGQKAKALDLLEAAMRARDTWLSGLKTDPFLDPLRQEPRFQAIERALNFPSSASGT
jgi:serine/threonine-protein kinase